MLLHEATLAPERRSAPPTRDELLSILGNLARSYDVGAIELLLEEYRRDAGEPATEADSVIAKLAARQRARRHRGGGGPHDRR